MKQTIMILVAVAALFIIACTPGCVERALVITSEPTGAYVTVNQQWRGTTPYVLPFKHYGVYDIWIEHPGIEEDGRMVNFYPMHVGEPVNAPGYQKAGADFVTEVLLPTTLQDQHNLHYILERVDQADDVDDVLARARQLREASQLRTQMRMEKDVARGRPVYGKSESGKESEQPEPEQGWYKDEYGNEIDATPPMPRELPVFENY